MSEKLTSHGYKVSYEPMTDDMSSELVENLEKGHAIALKGKDVGLKQLRKLIDKHPNIPQFKNYLTVWYQVRGNLQKAREVNQKTLQKHPDYLYAKVNLAHEYIENGQPEKVVELLGEDVEIKQMYPEREVFHITEVVPILKVSIKYFIKIKNFEEAEARLKMLKDLDWLDKEEIENYEKTLMFSKLSESPFFNREESEYIVEVKPQPETTKTEPPVFHHSEVYRLYEPTNFTQEEMKQFLTLPKQTLIQDLEMALNDSIERFTFFNEECTDFRETNFVMYSLMLLKELKAEESLPVVLKTLAQSEEYMDLYFGWWLTEYIWEIIFELGGNQLDILTDFMKRPYIYTFSKAAVSSATAQIAIYYPEKRKEIVDWNSELFQFYLNSDQKDGIIDDSLIGSMICDVIDFQGIELKEDIKMLFEKGYVDEMACGDWSSVSKDLENTKEPEKRDFREVESILQSLGKDENTDQYSDYEEVYDTPLTLLVTPNPKTGRNDLCFCGSGKKYKKCCLNK